MNTGKICVSVGAETAGEFVENIERAAEIADVVELRFDCLKESELDSALRKFSILDAEKPFIITFRPREQGGRREISFGERVKFWQAFFHKNKRKNIYVDFEFDLQTVFNLKTTESIVSFHDFSGVSENLSTVFEILKITNAEILKIAARADDITDALAVWKLLDGARAENKKLVPIAMGEAGKWTRILGLAYGAPLAYAALDVGSETAAGQLTIAEMIDVYRVKQLNEQTEIYGVVGNPIAQSLSPFMHNAAFKFYDLNAVYIPFEVKNLNDFVRRMVEKPTCELDWNLRGFSVTMPHKQVIVEHLDETDDAARAIGAVNTVKIADGKLCGFNTDADGFIAPLRNAYGDLRGARVALLGSGGAARACTYALKNEDANITIFARNLKKAERLAADFDIDLKQFLKTEDQKPKTDFNDFDVLINATPLGTKGAFENETPAIAAQIENVKLVYDLIYNPFETKLMSEARKKSVPTVGGLAMLVAQGAKQFEIWTEKAAPLREMSRAALRKVKNQKQ
jgi:3-dehydroquinate dehydratase/shikimate dehydrogenase